jgi:hypothetical protein
MLSRKPPIFPRETDSINDVLKNAFYFYRILGKERITLIKDILENESDIGVNSDRLFIKTATHKFIKLRVVGYQTATIPRQPKTRI